MYAKGYAILLIPTGVVYQKLHTIIKRLAEEYSAPVFEPHITLLTDIRIPENEIIQKIPLLIAGQSPFSVTLGNLDYQDFYFRALFVNAHNSRELQKFHDRAKAVFRMKNVSEFRPHLSLLYGDFPHAVKEKIIKEIGKDQVMEFSVKSIHLFNINGEVKAWHCIKEFTLKRLK